MIELFQISLPIFCHAPPVACFTDSGDIDDFGFAMLVLGRLPATMTVFRHRGDHAEYVAEMLRAWGNCSSRGKGTAEFCNNNPLNNLRDLGGEDVR